MSLHRRILLFSFLIGTIISTGVYAQDTPPVEPPTATVIPTDIPPTDIPPTPVPPPTDVPTETFTPEPSLTPIPPPTDTSVPTVTDTASPEASLTPSETSTDEASPTLTPSPSLTATASATVSLTPSMTASAEMQNQIGVIQPLANPIACTPSASIQQANVSSTGERGEVSGSMNSLSSDGRYLYFPSNAANLVANDNNNAIDYFEFDRTTCNTRRVTVGANGEEGDADSDVGNISGNGQYFAFASKASNFVAGDTNGKYDIFVKNLSTNAITRIPADPDNLISGAYYIGDVTISDDGHYVAFDVLISNGLGGFTGTPVLYDTQTPTRTVIASEGRSLYISGDGNYIAFVSSINTVAGDTNNVDDVFLYQRSTTNISRVSLAPDGSQFLTAYDYPSLSISGDGRYISFTSPGSVYVRDRLVNQTSLVSVDTNSSQIANAFGTRISFDGRFVLFMSNSTAIWVRDRTMVQSYQITNPYSSNGGLDISADGNYVAFSTQSGTSPNITRDVYVARRSDFALPIPPATATMTPISSFVPSPTPPSIIPCNPNASIQLVTVNSNGELGNQYSYMSSNTISDTGRYIAFTSSANNLVPNDSNNGDDVFLFDRELCQTALVSVSTNGEQSNYSYGNVVSMSGSGQFIVFTRQEHNYLNGDWISSIFLRDIQNNILTRISDAVYTSTSPVISSDGNFVVYTETVDNSTGNIFLYDRSLNQRKLIVTLPFSDPIASISRDGNTIIYVFRGTTYTNSEIRVYDRTTQQTTAKSIKYLGSRKPDISGNGRYILFAADGDNVVPNDTNNARDIFLWDRQTDLITRVSISSNGSQGNNSSDDPNISSDGRYIAFISAATNLVANDTNGDADVFVRDLQQSQTYLISTSSDGILGNSGSGSENMPISADNRFIAFHSYASNLVSGDNNARGDIFVAQRADFEPSNVSATQTAFAAKATASAFAIQTAVASVTNGAATPTPTPSLTPSTLTLTAYYMATYTAMMATYGPQMTATSEAGATYSAATETALAANCTAAGMSPLQLASVNILAGFGNNDSGTNSIAISDSGRYVAFISAASDLVWPDVNDAIDDVFLFDRQICQSILISKSPSGNQANHQSSSVAISADGQIIAFASAATNLVVGDTNSGIFVRNLTANTLIRIPNTTSASSSPSISGDGRYVTYTDLVNASTRNIMLYDIQMAQSKLIESVASSATYSKISRDGSAVFYFNAASSISIYSLSTLQVFPLTVNVNPAAMFDISADGRYIVFGSDATNLVVNDTNGKMDIFVLDQQTSQITRVSVSTNGAEAAAQSAFPAISPDGIFISFVSSAANLVANDTNNTSDVFVRDRFGLLTYIISSGPNGVLGNNSSGSAGAPMSGNGRYIAFVSNASNLVSGDTNAKADVFIADNLAYHPGYVATATAGAATATAAVLTPSPTASRTPLPTTTLGTPVGNFPCNPSASMSIASVDSAGTEGTWGAYDPYPYISSTGRYITYSSSSPNLVNGDTNGWADIFVFDRETCQTVRASVASDGTQGNSWSQYPSISSDGRYVTFISLATNLAAGDTDNLRDVFIKDLLTGTMTRLSAGFTSNNVDYARAFIASDDQSVVFATTTSISIYNLSTQQQTVAVNGSTLGLVRNPISSDLRYLVFTSFSNYVANDTNGFSDVYLLDRQTNQYSLLSASSTGIQGKYNSFDASISANGRYVVFSSDANNLVPNDNSSRDVFVRDLQLNTITRASISSSGADGNSYSEYGSISDDGRYITFQSASSNFTTGDSNSEIDIFVRDTNTNQTYLISQNFAGSIGNSQSLWPMISRDGSYITFMSSASNLITQRSTTANHAFVARRADFEPNNISATQTAVASATNVAATATAAANNSLVVNTISNTDDNTCNASHCSLVEAVNASNAMVGVQIIKFNIPGTGVHTITLSSSLILTSSAIIDGTTQPGYSGAPLIELVPLSSSTPYTAIVINGATPGVYDPNTSVTIRGLIINSFSGFGIHVSNGQQHLIEGNYIGTDATGSIAEGNDTGIIVTSPNNTIRDNVISGNLNAGIYMNSNGGRNSTNNLIVGNYIGTDASGINELPNQRGIRITEGASNNTIGGTADGTANLISSNLIEGILVDGNTTNGNIITGNIIGLDANSQYLLGNGTAGIGVSAALNTVIGGATAAEGNDIWGNTYGVNLYNAANNTVIRSNVIAQNGTQGIVLSTNNNTISNNTIAFHTGQGIVVSGGTGNRISQNRIYSNGGLGIDLGVNGVSPNDVGDADTGANNLQNFPVITSAVDSGLTSTVNGTFNSQPNQTYHLEFFSNAVCSASGYGQGQSSIGTTEVTTDANGNANFAAQVGSLAVGNNFGTNWSGTFYPSNNLTGTGVAVNNIQGLSFLWGTGAPVVNGMPVSGMPSDNFSAQFTSTQTFAAGTYTFIVSADDGVRVYVDGVLKLDKFVGRVLTTDSFTTALTAGSHSLTVEYFEGIDQAALQVQWHLNGVSNGFITATATDSNGNTSEFSACSPIQSVLSLGSYQENNENLVYSGSWVDFSGAGPKGGTFKYTNDANGKVRFMVDSSVGRITIYRTTYSIYGSTQVFVDGVLVATINSNSPNLVFGVQQTIAITPGNHTIVLQNVNSTYSSLDQIDLLPPANTLGIGTYQETDANLTYSGLWAANSTALALGGSRIYTNDPNGSVSFSINNTVGKVTIYHTTYLAGVYGPMQVYLDGAATPFATLNTTSASFTFGVPFSFFVTPGNHTITLKNVGSTYSDLDQIVLEAAVPLSTGIYQETDAALIYNGTWASNSNPSALGGSRKYTNDPNGSVSFVIDSSVSRITLYRTTYLAGVYGPTQVYLDNSTTPIATLNNTSASFVYGVPFTFTVTPGDHVVTLKNVGSTYSDIDQITLQGAAVPLGIGTYQETDANLTYSGLWAANSTALALGGSRIYTNDPNGSVSFSINNTVGKVTIYHTTYLAGVYGSMQVYLDGAATPFATLNTTSASFTFGVPFSFFVTPGSHTITLKNVGTTYSDLDQIVLEAAVPLSTGIYQETDAALIYNGTWASNSNPSALGGSRKYTNDPNGSVSFVIDSSVSRITLYRTTYLAGVYGPMQVYLDGATTPIATVNNTSASFVYGVPFTFTVTPGDHVVTLRNVGNTYSDLDQITLQGAAVPLGIGTYQETDANLTYSGLWAANSTALALGGSRIYTNDPNGSVSFSIDNTVGKVTIYHTTYLAGVYGPMQVYLDGAAAPVATLNTTSASFTFGVPFTFAVVPGSHTITLKNVGSTYSDLDQIVLEASTPLSTGTYQETDAALIYNGTWASNSNPSALGGSRKYTNDPNGSVSFVIDSSVSRITLYRTTYLAGVYGSTQVFVDNNPVPLTTISNTSAAFIYGQPSTFSVTPGDHVITLKNVGTTYSDIDQITLLSAAAPLGIGTYQETDVNLTYSGNWTPNINVLALVGSRIYTNDPNGSVSFSINNTVGKVTIYRTTYLAGVYGPMQVYLDGAAAPFATLNTTSASFVYGVPFTFVVTPGNHLITLKNVGTTYSDIDQITLQAAIPLSTGDYQETNANLVFNGVWTPNTTTAALGGARSYTNDPNGSVSFSIDTTVSKVTVYRTTYSMYGSMQVYLDNSPTPFATINNTSSAFLFQQPFTFTVTPGNHVVTLKNVGTTYGDLDQITLQP